MTTPISRDSIALQMYTLRAETRHDLLGTLKAVAGLGYKAVEFAGLQGVDPVLVRHALDALGMEAAAAHIPIQRWEGELGDVLNELHALGCVYAVVPWLEPERRGRLAEAESQLREMEEGARLEALVKIRNLMRGLNLTPADLGLVTAPKRRGRPHKTFV